MSDRDLRDRLRRAAAPEQDARERAWRVVRAGYAQHEPRPQRRAPRSAALVVAVAALAAAVATTSVPTDAVARWVTRVLGAGEPDARPALVSVPGGGRLLVTARPGVWVVGPDGTRRLLGRYEGAAWSPHGMFVLAWQGRTLTALQPGGGGVRWSLARAAPIRAAAWSPVDGFRVAYVVGSQLRIVNGDGTGDRRYGATLAGVAPAWRPDGTHVLAYAGRDDRVRVVAVDTARRHWRSAPIAGLRGLAWASGGRRLLALAPGRLIVFDRAGNVVREHPVPAAARAQHAAWSPDGLRIALSLYDARRDRSDVVLLDAVTPARGRLLFSGPGSFGRPAWSPGGERLLVPWPQADQWLFLRVGARSPVAAVANIAEQFDPGSDDAGAPTVAGWCC